MKNKNLLISLSHTKSVRENYSFGKLCTDFLKEEDNFFNWRETLLVLKKVHNAYETLFERSDSYSEREAENLIEFNSIQIKFELL